MKKQTGFQRLFEQLPLSMIEGEAPVPEDVSPQTVARVWERTAAACGVVLTAKGRRLRRLWLLPAVAILLVAAMVTALAFAVYSPPPVTYSFMPPGVRQFASAWVPSTYEFAVPIYTTVENNNLRVTLRCFTVDPLADTLHLSIDVETTDGTELTELTAQRISVLSFTRFDRITLSHENGAHILYANGSATNGGRAGLYRTDGGEDPCAASFALQYYAGNSDLLMDSDYVLELRDLVDFVRVTPDLGFLYPSMQALYDDMTPADETAFIRRANTSGVSASAYAYTLPDSGQRVSFSAMWQEAYIDNIGFRRDGGTSQLHMAIHGLSAKDKPVLIDMRDGTAYYVREAYDEGEDRTNLLYEGVTEEMLPHLFMMSDGNSDVVTRVEGTWSIPFSIGAQEDMTVRSFAFDEELESDAGNVRATALYMTDSTLYFEGIVTDTAPSEISPVWGDITLVMADGETIEAPFLKGARFDLVDSLGGVCRFGGEFSTFVDTREVVAVIVFGERIDLIQCENAS